LVELPEQRLLLRVRIERSQREARRDCLLLRVLVQRRQREALGDGLCDIVAARSVHRWLALEAREQGRIQIGILMRLRTIDTRARRLLGDARCQCAAEIFVLVVVVIINVGRGVIRASPHFQAGDRE
jgi:hypothetical protein